MAWKLISYCSDNEVGERLWHAGLSADARYCILFDCDEQCAIWDVNLCQTVWKDDGTTDSKYPMLDDWIDSNGCITIDEAPVAATYRLIGLEHNAPILRSKTNGNKISVDVKNAKLKVLSADRLLLQELKFHAFSGDWAYATFSEDGSTILVVEPYYISIFRESIA